MDDKNTCEIKYQIDNVNIYDKSQWNNILEFFIKYTEKFRKSIDPFLFKYFNKTPVETIIEQPDTTIIVPKEKQNMRFLDAAIKILLDNGNKPMSANDIWKEISKQKLVETNGKTPWASLNTIILYGCINSPINPEQLKKRTRKKIKIFLILLEINHILLN